MCLAIPGKVIEIKGDRAVVDYGGGTTAEANISMVRPSPGDYIIVHAGFAIEILNEEDALAAIDLWNEILESDSRARENAGNA